MSSSSFNDAFIHTPRYFTWFKNCTRTPFRKTFDGAGCLYFFGQKRTPIVLLQLKMISCSAVSSVLRLLWLVLRLDFVFCAKMISCSAVSVLLQLRSCSAVTAVRFRVLRLVRVTIKNDFVFKYNISMIHVLPLTNINTKIIKSKLSKIFISEVCIKLVVLHINRYTRSSSQFQKGW